jgi:hypothetical protein
MASPRSLPRIAAFATPEPIRLDTRTRAQRAGRTTMKHHRPIRGTLRWTFTIAAALALASSLGQAAQARRLDPPPVPAGIAADAGSVAFFAGHAVGTQDYVCLPSGSSFAWTLITPQATLFGPRDQQLTTHFFSPNPLEAGTVRPAWQHSRDTSTVWGKLHASSADSAYVAPGAIPWLLLDVAGAAAGPNGGNALTAATQIHRVNTFGGAAPATGCTASSDVGKKEFVPYEADYFFYSNSADEED